MSIYLLIFIISYFLGIGLGVSIKRISGSFLFSGGRSGIYFWIYDRGMYKGIIREVL